MQQSYPATGGKGKGKSVKEGKEAMKSGRIGVLYHPLPIFIDHHILLTINKWRSKIATAKTGQSNIISKQVNLNSVGKVLSPKNNGKVLVKIVTRYG